MRVDYSVALSVSLALTETEAPLPHPFLLRVQCHSVRYYVSTKYD